MLVVARMSSGIHGNDLITVSTHACVSRWLLLAAHLLALRAVTPPVSVVSGIACSAHPKGRFAAVVCFTASV
jgi:hypothetical protein